MRKWEAIHVALGRPPFECLLFWVTLARDYGSWPLLTEASIGRGEHALGSLRSPAGLATGGLHEDYSFSMRYLCWRAPDKTPTTLLPPVNDSLSLIGI